MGQTLSEPVTSKDTSTCENSLFQVASSCMQGWRMNMEDAHSHILSLDGVDDAAFFAVYDGHGGAKVAQYAGKYLHHKLVHHDHFSNGQIEEAIKHAFLEIDQDMLHDDEMKEELAGTTACVVLVKDSKIYCGNVGDSRAIASVRGEVEQLSFDHKPTNDIETKRILAAGGWVEFNRVNGNLALSRALGDFVFKRNDRKTAEEQIVTAYPDVVVHDISEEIEFLILACDGIWDVLTNQEVVDFIRTRIAQQMTPSAICEDLMTRCLAPDCQMGGLGCDNMTVVLVCFLHGRPYHELVVRCREARKLDDHIINASNYRIEHREDSGDIMMMGDVGSTLGDVISDSTRETESGLGSDPDEAQAAILMQQQNNPTATSIIPTEQPVA